jgi:hypothetical protein
LLLVEGFSVRVYVVGNLEESDVLQKHTKIVKAAGG